MLGEALAILTGVSIVFGVYFAFRQRRNERLKARLEAYPKRVAVFRCTEEFLNRAWTGNYDYQPALLAAFYHCKREARFLFDKELADYLDYLYDGVERHFHVENRLEIEGPDADFETKSMFEHQCFASRAWLGNQNVHLKEKFAKYLDLSGVK